MYDSFLSAPPQKFQWGYVETEKGVCFIFSNFSISCRNKSPWRLLNILLLRFGWAFII